MGGCVALAVLLLCVAQGGGCEGGAGKGETGSLLLLVQDDGAAEWDAQGEFVEEAGCMVPPASITRTHTRTACSAVREVKKPVFLLPHSITDV